MVEDLRIYLLGEFRLYRKGVLVASKDWYTRQARQLFKLLLTEQGRTVTVEKLTDLLWPEYSETAHKTLRSAVNALRSVLEPERKPHTPSRFVLSGQAGYRLVLPEEVNCWIDAVDFEKKLDQALAQDNNPQSRALLASALQLYVGDYLSEDQTDSWAVPERERLRERYFNGVGRLGDWLYSAALYAEAVAVCRKALNLDACREPLYRIMMECQAAQGDTVAALQTFERCRQLLDEQLGADPSPQTLELHSAILKGEFKPKSSQKYLTVETSLADSNQTAFVGRQAEIEVLLRQLARSKENITNTVAVVGEAGVGKSFLVQQFLRQMQNQNNLILSTSCQAIEQGVSFAPLISALTAWLRVVTPDELDQLPRSILAQIAPLLPQLSLRVPSLPIPSAVNSEQAYSRLVTGIVDLFAALTRHNRPLILGWDDVQWADESTLLVINRLARLENLPILLLVSYRAEDLSENKPLGTMLRYLGRDNRFTTISLERFNSEEVAQYLRLQKANPPLSAEELYRTTQGNALFLAEAVRVLLENYPDESVPFLQSQQIRDIILARVNRLPQLAVSLLETAAIIGRPFTLDLLRPNLSNEEFSALEILLERRFLVEFKNTNDREVRLTFSHEMVKQVVYAACSPLKLQHWHRQVAENMVARYAEATYQHAAEIAAHYRLSGVRYEPQVLRYEVEAGDYARRSFSYRQALSHYNSALAVLPQLSVQDRQNYQSWIGKAYQGGGLACEALLDWEGVKENYRRLSDWAISVKDWDLATTSARRVAIVRGLMGQLAEAAELNQSSPNSANAPVADMIQRWTSLQMSNATPPLPALQEIEELPPFCLQNPPDGKAWHEIVERLGASQAALMLFQYGWALLLQGLTGDAEDCLNAALNAAEETNQAACWVLSAMLMSRIYYIYGDGEEGNRWFERCIEFGKKAPEADWALTWPRLSQAFQLISFGRLIRAEDILRTMESQLAERDDFLSYRYAVQIGWGLLELARGNLDKAEALLETALSNQAGVYIEAYIGAEVALARIAHQRGQTSEAFARFRRMLVFSGQRGLLQFYCSIALDLARLCLDSELEPFRYHQVLELLEKVEALSANSNHRLTNEACRNFLAQLRAKTPVVV
jgi:DNA-binding SARP family transcriptional activator